MSEFGTKNAFFGFCCHIRNPRTPIFKVTKFGEGIKMPKFCTKSALFGFFWAEI